MEFSKKKKVKINLKSSKYVVINLVIDATQTNLEKKVDPKDPIKRRIFQILWQ